METIDVQYLHLYYQLLNMNRKLTPDQFIETIEVTQQGLDTDSVEDVVAWILCH